MRPQKEVCRGFTLIELLLVIAIIGGLTALIVSAMGAASPKAKIALAHAELAQMESAIQDYKVQLGFYPPDNPADATVNPLWFELAGTTNNGLVYVTLDGSGRIPVAGINATFHRQGFANSGTRAHTTDTSAAPMSFLKQLRAAQVSPLDDANPQVKILVCSVQWPAGSGVAPIPGKTLNPWRCVSTNPTNNPGSYDLWVDLVFGKKTYQVNNWSR